MRVGVNTNDKGRTEMATRPTSGHGTSLPELLRRAVDVGTPQARMDLGIAALNKKIHDRYGKAAWYGAVELEPIDAPDGRIRQFRLFGENRDVTGVKRELVESLGEAEEFDTYRDCLSACSLQGEGVPMHGREAVRIMPRTAVLTPSSLDIGL